MLVYLQAKVSRVNALCQETITVKEKTKAILLLFTGKGILAVLTSEQVELYYGLRKNFHPHFVSCYIECLFIPMSKS